MNGHTEQHTGSIKRRFSPEEDDIIRKEVQVLGEGHWREIAEKFHNRTARQVRERWNHYLSPRIRSGPWSQEEDQALLSLVKKFGKRWKAMEPFLPGRTHITIKNNYNMISRVPKRKKSEAHIIRTATLAPIPITLTRQPTPMAPPLLTLPPLIEAPTPTLIEPQQRENHEGAKEFLKYRFHIDNQ